MKIKLLIPLLLLLLVLTPSLALAIDDPVVGDDICERDLGENRENSVDCEPSPKDYFACMLSIDDCQDLRTHNEVFFFLAGLSILLFVIIIARRFY